MSHMIKAYRDGKKAGMKSIGVATINDIYQLAYSYGYAHGTEEFNQFLEGYAEGIAHELTEKTLKSLREFSK